MKTVRAVMVESQAMSLPRWLDDRISERDPHISIDWKCPSCGRIVVETVVFERGEVLSMPTAFSPVRRPEADENGIPFYGPSNRVIHGKSERRAPSRLIDGQRAVRRVGNDRLDHEEIFESTFITVCKHCPERLLIELTPA